MGSGRAAEFLRSETLRYLTFLKGTDSGKPRSVSLVDAFLNPNVFTPTRLFVQAIGDRLALRQGDCLDLL